MKEPWIGNFPPFRMRGNLYFVGTEPASTHIIDTGDGLIMLDSGYQHSLYLVLQNMHTLGLGPMNIKTIPQKNINSCLPEIKKRLSILTAGKSLQNTAKNVSSP